MTTIPDARKKRFYTWACVCACGFSRRCADKHDAQRTAARHADIGGRDDRGIDLHNAHVVELDQASE